MHHSDGNKPLLVWAIDGNVKYWGPKHVGLFVIGIICFIVLWPPYTLTLLLVPCLKRWDHLKPLRWINKLKPFYDSYYGPFKDKIHCQCWIGALLIIRGMVLVTFASTSTSNPNANILFLVVIVTILLTYGAIVGRQYKKWHMSLLENLYILNLGILGGSFLFTQLNCRANSNNQENAIDPGIKMLYLVSISLAMIQATCIVIFHLIQQCQDRFYKCQNRRKGEVAIGQTNPLPQLSKVENIDRSYSNELRESLLDYTYDVQ